jgi:GMP synthase-like glutamine amidotransferase
MQSFESESNNRERLFSQELKRELSPAEREFLETELQHTRGHHETMANIIEQFPDFKVLFIDATDKGTVGSDFFTELSPELLNYLTQIHTGEDFSKSNFNYKKFSENLFRYMLGFKSDDPRFETIRTIEPDSPIPDSTAQYSLIVGSGGEVNHQNTQPEYADQLNKIQEILKQVLHDQTPFLATCATHQIIGELIYEMEGGIESIIDNLHDEHGGEISESGVIDLFTNEQARSFPLTANLPEKFSVMSNHGQYLTEVPKGAVSLAGNRFQDKPVPTQLLGYKNGIGIQAHPEFSPVVIFARNRLARAMAAWKGQELPAVAEVDNRPTWEAREIIFPEIVKFAAKAKQDQDSEQLGV